MSRTEIFGTRTEIFSKLKARNANVKFDKVQEKSYSSEFKLKKC